eukprot:m.68746 g.68746  ORF g.68746 m.68746 type:complete len:56 (+) comp23986_c1_seq3:1432-1599(+)
MPNATRKEIYTAKDIRAAILPRQTKTKTTPSSSNAPILSKTTARTKNKQKIKTQN